MRYKIFVVLMALIGSVYADDFEFEDTIAIMYLPKSGGSHLYMVRGTNELGTGMLTALLDRFLPYVTSMGENEGDYPQPTDEFLFISAESDKTIYLGKYWLGDGDNIVPIAAEDYDFFQKNKERTKLNEHPRGVEKHFFETIRNAAKSDIVNLSEEQEEPVSENVDLDSEHLDEKFQANLEYGENSEKSREKSTVVAKAYSHKEQKVVHERVEEGGTDKSEMRVYPSVVRISDSEPVEPEEEGVEITTKSVLGTLFAVIALLFTIYFFLVRR